MQVPDPNRPAGSLGRRFGSLFRRPADATGTPFSIWMLAPDKLFKHARTLIRNPRYFSNRVAVMLFQIRRPEAPWLTAESIRLLEAYLQPSMSGFEWGSGRSTIWLGKRLQSLVSIEHDPEWHAQVKAAVSAGAMTNIDCRLVQRQRSGAYAGVIGEFPDRTFDVILIDGEERNACIREAVAKVRIGGVIVLDNADADFDLSPLTEFQYRPTSNGVWRTDLFTSVEKPQLDGGDRARRGQAPLAVPVPPIRTPND